VSSEHYSQCLPTAAVTDGTSTHAAAYGQCGGNNWEGPTQCAAGYTCNRQSAWYSQCVPTSASLLGRRRAVVKAHQHLQK
jgi:hypothetical protein